MTIYNMACGTYTLNGLNTACKESSLGGIRRVYFALADDVAEVTVTADKITGITMADGKKFKEYKLLKNTGSMTSTLNVSDTAASYFTNEITLQFMKQETAKRIEIMSLLMAETVAIVQDANGTYWYMGKDYPITATGGTAETGTAAGDANRYELTLSDDSKELPYEVNADILTDIVDPIA